VILARVARWRQSLTAFKDAAERSLPPAPTTASPVHEESLEES